MCLLTNVEVQLKRLLLFQLLVRLKGDRLYLGYSYFQISVCSSEGQINAHIILSGDPKQLGPVVQSKIAEKMGYGNNIHNQFAQL